VSGSRRMIVFTALSSVNPASRPYRPHVAFYHGSVGLNETLLRGVCVRYGIKFERTRRLWCLTGGHSRSLVWAVAPMKQPNLNWALVAQQIADSYLERVREREREREIH
jgi:hypothetical protein